MTISKISTAREPRRSDDYREDTWRVPYHCNTEKNSPWERDDVFDLPRPKNFAVPFSSVLKHAEQLSLFVDIDPEILGGTPRIDGTRIPVYMVLNAIDEHGSVQGAAHAYRSSITEGEVRDALRFAVHVLESPLEYKPTPID
jgi:uncharacterized protein (DUF433 family)